MISKKVHFTAILLSAIAAIYFDTIGEHSIYSFLKPLTSILIIFIPILHGARSPKQYWLLTIVALVFCLVGDVLLLSNELFVFGLGAFLLAHILFLFSFKSIGGFKIYITPLFGLVAIGGAYFYYLSSDLGEMLIPVFLYFIFIVLMCWQGINLYIWRKESAYQYIAMGVILFLISDSLIALNKFKMPFELSSLMVLSTYWMAIFLLASATALPKTAYE